MERPPDILDLGAATSEELRAALAVGLGHTARSLAYFAGIWAELERRGEDLSSLRKGLYLYLPKIAAGLLAAEAVVAFANRPLLIRDIEGVALAEQRRLAAGEFVAFVNPERPREVIEKPLLQLPPDMVRVAYWQGERQTPEAQRLLLRQRKATPTEPKERFYQPRLDKETGTLHVGTMKVRQQDVLSAMVAASGPDKPPPADIPEEVDMVRVLLSHDEYRTFQAACARAKLPESEMARKALKAFGLI